MANKSDKPYILGWIIGCFIVMLIFHFIPPWIPYLFMNYHRSWFFLIGDIVLLILFVIGGIFSYATADDPNKEGWRKEFIWVAIISCIWAASWSSALMNQLDQGL